ncbi:MAG: hypothetical protein KC413_03685, partial [Anaerolineales bacterium]|nr:hypothetical protein [Anaerolineales bacterium]
MYKFVLISLLLFGGTGCNVAEQDNIPTADVAANAVVPNAITAANVDQIVPLQHLGDGVMTQIALSPSDDTLVVGTTIGVYIYDDGDTAVPRDFYPTDEPVEEVAISPDGQILAVVIRPSNTT